MGATRSSTHHRIGRIDRKVAQQCSRFCPELVPYKCNAWHHQSCCNIFRGSPCVSKMGQIANRQSLVFSERGQLSHAIPQFHVERTLHQLTPIARFESQRNERRAYEDQILCFGGRYELQRTLAIRIAAITLASDSAITIARFRPSKMCI